MSFERDPSLVNVQERKLTQLRIACSDSAMSCSRSVEAIMARGKSRRAKSSTKSVSAVHMFINEDMSID